MAHNLQAMLFYYKVCVAAIAIAAAPLTTAQITWDAAYTLANQAVSSMNVTGLVSLGSGSSGGCLGNVAPVGSIGSLCLQDSPIAVRLAYNVTGGIAGINVAATFDKALALQRGQQMGMEFKGKGVNIQLGPDINMMRSPDAGRNWETFGEDPYLTGILGAQTIIGTQSQGVIATAKHYILYEQETDRTWESSNADDRTLHEIYLWPFARAVEAGVGAIMCSYNRINETYACQNNDTLTTILKGELGFRGFVMSDWGATMSGAPSILAGLDMDMPGGDGNWGSNMVSNVNAGTVPLSRAQDAATRIAAAYYKMGQQSGFPTAAINSNNPSAAPYVNVQADHSTLIRQIGAASAILLKNQGNILPLKTPATLGVIGGDAADSAGDYGAQGCQVLSCDNGTLAMGWGSGGSYLPYLINPLQGIQTRAPTGTKVISSLDVWNYTHAAQVAATVDIAIVFGNADSGEGIDRNNLSLWYNADALITAVATANPNTIAVIHAAGPVLMPWINLVKGVIYAGLPGQETGNSLADVLWGDVNPSGRLPYTLAKATADYPAHVSSDSDISYSEGLLMGYRYFDAKNVAPLFEFGFGLSYTTFAYSGLGVTSNNANVTVSITIQNNGSVSGAEVPQLYIGFPTSAGEPPKVLRGFEKVTVAAGAKTTVSFVVSIAKELSVWDSPSSSWIVPSGTFTAYVGASSRDIRQQTTFTVTGGGNSGGWTYLGCYVDTLNPRTLPYAAAAVGTGMTVEACESECLAASYKFAGVEYGNECWCGNTQPATAATPTDCNMACAGMSSETCGAGSRLNVYSYGTSTSTTTSSTTTTTTATKTTTSKTTSSTTTTTTIATATPTSGWKYLGCYVDALTPRTLPYGAPAVSSGMTVEACESECLAANYVFAGVEYGNECWCGNTMPPTAATASDCSMTCAGNAAEMCGAGGRFNLYQYS